MFLFTRFGQYLRFLHATVKLILVLCSLLTPSLAQVPNPIVVENQRPGTYEWGIPPGRESWYGEVEGYGSKTSVAPGEAFEILVNVSVAQDVRWQAFRLGFYQGWGGRLVASGGPARVSTQPRCPVDLQTGLIECRWTPAFRIVPGSNWVTGQYLIKLIRADGFQAYVPLVIREPFPRAPLLVQASITTWQAYNAWGGASLYYNDPGRTGFQGSRAYRVSFDRPYDGSFGPPGSGQLLSYEIYMLKWLEQRGYDLAYLTNVDIDAKPQFLRGRQIFLSVGHDEYWSVPERDAVESARDSGVSLGFFSANTAYWRIRLEPSSTGAPRRVVTCYKSALLDPLGDTPLSTTQWRDLPFPRPENALLGVMSGGITEMDGFRLVVTNPSHWLYEGTGVVAGESLPHIVGIEWDRVHDNGLTPATLEVVAHAMTIGWRGTQDSSDMVVYYPNPRSIVFAAGTIEWGWGLSLPDYVDPRIQRITENVLARAGLRVAVPTVVPALAPAREPGNARSVSLTAGSGAAGALDGPARVAQFNSPAGVAAGPDGTLYVTEARNHRVRAIAPDGSVSTLAGCGPEDEAASGLYSDGTGFDACFNVPTGIAMASSGILYVSDTRNNCIRAINPATQEVTTYAGTTEGGYLDAANPRDARFMSPRGLAVGPDQALYVADSWNGSIRRIGPSGVTTVASGLSQPTGVAVGSDGTLYTVETTVPGVGRIPLLQAGEPPEYGDREVLAGGLFGDLGGPGAAARLRPVEGLAVMGNRLVFSDTANYRVRAVDLGGAHNVTTLVGNGRFGAGEGTGATTRVVLPRGLTVYREGLAVADSANHRVIFVQP